MENIEIKAAFPDLERGVALAISLGASDEGVMHQVDTYFKVSHGRLKLRENDGKQFELIYYERPDEDGPTSSVYQILPVQDPATLKTILDQAIGIRTVVDKRRRLFLFDEVRIHLDHVDGLGGFIEFEGVVQREATRDAARAKVQRLVREFGIMSADLQSGSYSDMLRPPQSKPH